jgi:hypothetical protein
MRRSSRRVLAYGNGFLLLLTFVFISVGITAHFSGHIFDHAGRAVRETYVSYFSNRADEALRELSAGSDMAARDLLKNWDDVLVGDRLYAKKRQVFLALTNHLYEQGRFSDVTERARLWLRQGTRDIEVKTIMAASSRQIPGRELEGKEALATLWSDFPEHKRLTRFYAESALADGDINALRLIRTAMEQDGWKQPSLGGWQIFWDTGDDFNEKESATVEIEKQGAGWRIVGNLPSRLVRLRIDPPAFSNMRLRNFQITLGGETQPFPIELVESNHMIRQRGEWFETTGENDPSFLFSMKTPRDERKKTAMANIVIFFEVESIHPDWFEEIFEKLSP